jgi:hypothetical protein
MAQPKFMADAINPIPAPVPRPLYWKFSRDGAYSKVYISFIFDVPDNQIKNDGKVWHASFHQLGTVLLLLQDVELLNRETLEHESFFNAVHGCGYLAPKQTEQLRGAKCLVSGKDIIGRYNGEPIPFGVGPTSADYKTIGLDISWFKPWALLNGKDGKIIKSGGLSSFQRKNGKSASENS